MLAEWTAECTIDAPTLVVPWADAASGLRFIDLRAEPYAIADIAEAEHYPPLARALRSLNAARSPLISAKCDAWRLTQKDDAEDLDALRLELDLDADDCSAGMASYIDLLWRDRGLFASAHQQQSMLDRLARRFQRLEHRHSAVACVLRPAVMDLAGTLEGFAFTLYLRSAAGDAETAIARWAAALDDVTAVLRGRSLMPAAGSATIDEAGAYPLRVRHMGE